MDPNQRWEAPWWHTHKSKSGKEVMRDLLDRSFTFSEDPFWIKNLSLKALQRSQLWPGRKTNVALNIQPGLWPILQNNMSTKTKEFVILFLVHPILEVTVPTSVVPNTSVSNVWCVLRMYSYIRGGLSLCYSIYGVALFFVWIVKHWLKSPGSGCWIPRFSICIDEPPHGKTENRLWTFTNLVDTLIITS